MALIEKLTAIGDAIREKTNTTGKLRLDEMPGMISSITGGHSELDAIITFYDWDGTVLHQYPRKTFETMSALPIPPEMDGYTCDGWNYSIDTIKAMSGSVNVCTMYRKNDVPEEETETPEPKYVDRTKLYLEIPADMDIELRYMQSITSGVTVNWGDGETSVSESYGSTNITATHSYKKGNYVISFDILDGCTLTLGAGDANYNVLGSTSTSKYYRAGTLKKVEIDLRTTKLSVSAFRSCIALEDVIIGDGTGQGLSNSAFQYCLSLKNVELPNSITSFGNACFRECYKLKSIIIPESVVTMETYAFYNCRSLQSIVIPKSIASIGGYVFSGCYALKEVTIKNGVKTINDQAFNGCYSLKKIEIPNSVTRIGQSCFSGCRALESISLPSNSTTSYGSSVFYSCYALKKVLIPNVMGNIPDSMFQNCNLKFVGIPKSTKTIFNSAFTGNFALRNVSLGENVEQLAQAFNTCYAVEKVIIPSSVTIVSAPVFSECKCLKEVSFPETLDMGSGILYNCSFDSSPFRQRVLEDFESKEEIPYYAFAGNPYLEDITVKGDIKPNAFYDDYILSKVKILNGVKLIDVYAFQNDYALENVSFPESLEVLAGASFYGCQTLKELTFPEIEIRQTQNFYQCYGLKKVRFEGNINAIGGALFERCYALSDVEFAEEVKTAYFASSAFRNTLLEKIPDFPEDTTLNLENAFSDCYALVEADLSNINRYNSNTNSLFTNCYALEKVILPENGQNVSMNRTFYNCWSLEKVEVPENVAVTSDSTFAYCNTLKNVKFADYGLTAIGTSAFYYCYNLKEIKIPRSVAQINYNSFYYCYSLIDIYMYPLTPPTIINGSYFDAAHFPPCYKIYVPKGHIEEYRAKWAGYNYGDHMVEFEYMQATKEAVKKNIALSDTNMAIKGMLAHSDFDDEQKFTVTCSYSGQNLENLSATYDWKTGIITLNFNKTNNVIYEKYEDIVVTVSAVGVEDATVSFTVQAKCYAWDFTEEYTVTNISTTYGFMLQDDGYYESNNQNRNNTYCLCRVDFVTTSEHMYVDCVGEGETNYDFGILSKLDTILNSNNSEDPSSLVQKSFKGNASYNETVTYEVPDAEQHYIYIKYRKDSSNSVGKDCLRFKIRFLESEE